MLLRERATPYRAKICSCRYNGKWSAHLLTITCAQQAGSGDALFNRLWRLARSPYRARARILQTSFFDCRERSGNVFVTFARFLANMTQILRTPGTALFVVGKIAHHALALEIPRQILAATLFLPRSCWMDAGLSAFVVIVISCTGSVRPFPFRLPRLPECCEQRQLLVG